MRNACKTCTAYGIEHVLEAAAAYARTHERRGLVYKYMRVYTHRNTHQQRRQALALLALLRAIARVHSVCVFAVR